MSQCPSLQPSRAIFRRMARAPKTTSGQQASSPTDLARQTPSGPQAAAVAQQGQQGGHAAARSAAGRTAQPGAQQRVAAPQRNPATTRRRPPARPPRRFANGFANAATFNNATSADTAAARCRELLTTGRPPLLNALLAKPHERSDTAKDLLARQPMIAAHPLVAGTLPRVRAAPAAAPGEEPGRHRLVITSEYEPKGDQPQAIKELVAGVTAHERDQVLLGVTGSGKTFTMAQVIQATQRPALVLAPNKTLAAQLYGEFKSFFPDNAVEYFVSYYDYYQPEAYVPRTDTYIEKESSVNEQIDRMRHSATRALLERDDVIIVASVSCIYGIGSVETYTAMTFTVKAGETHRAAPADRRHRRPALQAQRPEFRARHVSRARRYRRPVPGPFGRPRLALHVLWRRDREHHRVRSADRRQDRCLRAGQDLLELALRDAEADAAAGDEIDQVGADPAPRRAASQRPPAGGAAPRAAHAVRHGDDGGDRVAAPASRTTRAI